MPEPRTYLDNVWARHEIRRLGDGRSLIFIDRLLQELSTPRTLEQLREVALCVVLPGHASGFVARAADAVPWIDAYRASSRLCAAPAAAAGDQP